ncbi:MAG: prepilin peptidase [Neisseria sp.]|jgi:type 4 prepilin-like proteins leader peptide-processing enzyme|uniref:Prepilin leader peptidase/N-methyltransferase n=1 Tax=Neisseria mucosa (strain ATCC 25996 / DSM 4631 / NCTC 10774 / M26) TaxID=546266 RepID=D2ZTB9_NEIM2|nr:MULTISPECIES: A24 family peptidase [Neisseria]MBS5837048.1 prepilin peptidase [Neisseria sp.]OFN31291.1 methyltransferase [Neisseria sp. HMSC059F02]OHR42471.1 methyltransferase [Neisseria sp. HMSC070E12]EFC89439.1 bacterial peptidase A24, N-terminal domain protein [Neisseria mucosa ATCC 25996]MBS6045545.1 prepilin peptidase [Neisseria sp.]
MFESLDTLAPFAIPLSVVVGLLIGSFLNVVIYRVPVMMERGWTQFAKEHLQLELTEEEQQPFNLMKPDSRCPKCHAPVKAWQNIPIVSYLMLGGKCGSCKTPISIRYPLIELLTGILFGVVAWQYGWTMAAFGGLILTAILIALTFIDADTQYLPDSLTLPLIWLGLLFNLNGTFVPLKSAVLGAVFGYMSLWLLCFIYKLLTGKIGMGNGDFKLLAALGAWLGVGILPVLVFMAALIGLVGAIIGRIAKGQYFAFGPSLAIAGWIILVVNEPVHRAVIWWLTKSGF